MKLQPIVLVITIFVHDQSMKFIQYKLGFDYELLALVLSRSGLRAICYEFLRKPWSEGLNLTKVRRMIYYVESIRN